MEVFNPGISVTTYPLLTSLNTQTKQGNELHLFVAYRLEFLRNGPDKNNSNNGNEHVGMHCLLSILTSDWLKQQKLTKLHKAVHIFILTFQPSSI